MDTYSMPMPVDLHQHFRDGAMLGITIPNVARRFRAALAMPNLTPPVVTYEDALEYHNRLRVAFVHHAKDYDSFKAFQFLMTIYLTDKTKSLEVLRCINSKDFWFAGIKYYPRGLTTNSDSGLQNPADMWTPHTETWRVLRTLATYEKTLFVHAADGVDVHGEELDPYEQERHFLKHSLPKIRDAHPELKISLEHLSTAEGAKLFIAAEACGWHPLLYNDKYLGASLTPHHLLLDRRDMLRGGFHPGRFWLPLLQTGADREMLRTLAASGHPRVWLGSDSAPHPRGAKLNDCCKGGVLTAHAGVELYVEAFEAAGALDKLEAFACYNGPRFIGLPDTKIGKPGLDRVMTERRLYLRKNPWRVPQTFCWGTDLENEDQLTPFRAGEEVQWQLVDDSEDEQYREVVNENGE